MNSTAVIFDRLSGDTGISFDVANYDGIPAIFNDRAPDDFQFSDGPAVVIAAPSSDTDASTLTETIRAITQEVRVYGKDNGSTATIDILARYIRDLFHLKASALSVQGGKVTIATATGPVAAPTTDPSLVGRRIVINLELQKV